MIEMILGMFYGAAITLFLILWAYIFKEILRDWINDLIIERSE